MIMAAEKLANFETIYCSSNSIIYKAFNEETNEKVIIKTLNKELYDAKSLSKLKNEYKLLKELQGEYVVKAYKFLNVENRFSMVIEDFRAISLDQYLSTSRIGIREFLYIALEITKCLDHIHKNQVIHKDINPSNIVYNKDNKVLKLIDFGIASKFSFETMQPLNPNKLEGTLSYISPEQTGRMNRPVDYRTDFYSLGVTLYELACRRLPFVSDDPAEIVHCHIAKTPWPAHQVNPEIPKAVSGIIAKLMAKMPENRYKNAQGIMFDLYTCLEQIDDSGVVEEFELGSRDISDKFEVPKKLYGRKYDLEKLLASFENISKGSAEFILIGGYSGIGKTSLVNELHKPIMKEHGMFISGKYDQFNRNTPYSACFQAIDQFCSYILSEPETEIERWKKRISEALGSNRRLITEVVPRLGLIIGEQPALGEIFPIEEQTRFKIALKNLMAVISAPEHPVVFFMDDVHWADMASLDLFERLLMDHTIKGLMFVGTYRDNEVDSSHPLIRSIEKIRRNNGRVQFIKLENINVHAVANIISAIVSRPEQDVLQLAGIVHERTLGNPFYTIEFLKHCNDKDLLYYDQGKMRWDWNETGICSSQISDNVADYLIGKIETLSETTRDLIKIAACIGNHFDVKVLSAVAGKGIEIINDELKPAIYEEMVYVAENREDNFKEMQFKFCHDKFQQAGYQALSEDVKKTIHLNIARYYKATEVLEGKYLFVVADHYSKALDCLVSTQEIEKVIEIFFKAAHSANLSSAYDTARQYLELIMEISPEDLKKNDSFLLRIYNEYHLVLFSLARFEELDRTYTKIEKISKNPLDLVDCCCLQLISLSNRSRYQEGFVLGVALLERLGIKYPQDALMDVVDAEFEKYCEYERNGSIEKIEKREMLRDIKGKSIAKLLNRIVPAAQFFNPLAAFWATLVNANIMVENGVTGVALEMSWGFFMGVIAYKNDFRCGNMLAKKAMHIVEREGLNAELYRMYHFNGLVRCHWFEPIEQDIYYAHEAYKGNLQNGEFEFSCYSFFTSQAAILECCNTVSEMQDEVEAALSFASKMGNIYGLESFVSFQQIVRALRGETITYGSFNDENFNEEKHVEDVQHNAIGLAYYYIYRSLSAVLFGDFKMAFMLTEKAVPLMPYIASFYTAALLRFLHSLSICKTIEEMKESEQKNTFKKILEENQQWMYQRAKDAPFNFQHLYYLVDAEVKALAGKYDESFRLYEKAIFGAKENKRPYHCALACELAGQRYYQIGIERIAGFYLKEAYSAFLAWGATGKIESMKQKYPHILFSGMDSAKLVELNTGTTVLTNSTNITALTKSIDINAVIKATQTISGQIGKKKLLEKLMTIIIENSGSNRGCILTIDENSWLLYAYEIVNRSVKIIIDDQKILLDSMDKKHILPLSIISYVMRTKEPVIIDNVLDSQFSSDRYFIKNTTLSAMCFPILSHNILKGIVYLENDLLTEAFTQERIEVLNIFTSQAAISLENSNLYSNLEEKVKERTSQLQKTNAVLEERTAELAVAKEKTEAANKELETQNLQLQHEIIVRKRVEEEQRLNLKRLRLSEERFGKIFNDSPIMMSISTPKKDIYIDVNAKWEEIMGYSRQEIIGHSFTDLDIWIDDASNWPEVIGELNEKRNVERTIRTKSGEIRVFLISQTVVNINNEQCWLSASIDITERKKMEQEMARLDRLNMVGEMAASIGHEIRNPMTSVRGFLQMFEDKYSEDKEFLDLMIEELDRANAIITEFLSLAKNKLVELIPQKLNPILKNILPLILATATIQDKSIKLEMEHVPNLLLDEKEIRQLILNLVHNGLEAMAPGGTIIIRTFTEGENVILSIQDQGSGVDPEVLDKLGTPFFTTKEQGTGLGLAVCYGIAKRHNARIDIKTSSIGTTFFVQFPI
ncbi:MAG: AAA family ATPase [Syntrophomonas sp.]|nr:AAA family ATPase [Syntrophomonas sp.]